MKIIAKTGQCIREDRPPQEAPFISGYTFEGDVTFLSVKGSVVHLYIDGDVTHLNINGDVTHLNIKQEKTYGENKT